MTSCVVFHAMCFPYPEDPWRPGGKGLSHQSCFFVSYLCKHNLRPAECGSHNLICYDQNLGTEFVPEMEGVHTPVARMVLVSHTLLVFAFAAPFLAAR